MPLYRWPNDPPGPARHSIPYKTHQAHLLAKRAPAPRAPVRPAPARPAAPRPAAPVAPRPAPQPIGAPPPDPTYENDVGLLARTRDETLGQIGAQRVQQLAGYGYNETAPGQVAFDPNNPFSKAALLKRSYDQKRRSTGGQMAAAGQLYSGAYQSGQDVVNRGQLQDTDVLQRNLQDFLARNTARRGEAETTYQTGVMSAESNRLGRLEDLENPLYEPVSDLPAPSPAATRATPRAAPRRRTRRPRGR